MYDNRGVLMKNIKKLISLLVCSTILLTVFTSCELLDLSVEPTTQAAEEETPVEGLDEIGYTLAFLRTDSLNPYECESETNMNIAKLMFDPLFNVGNDFKASAVIAESYEYTADNKITVKIKSGLTFTDSTALSAEDVVYSFVLAKKSDSYSALLKNLTDASADGNGNVVFTLKKANPYEVSNLTFPIIKKDSDKDTSSSDDYSSAIPIGSGRYTLKTENENKKLVANKTRLGSYIPKYNFIGLRDITEVSSIPGLFDLNEVDFYTESFSDGVYKRYSGTSATFETTNFVYLGINSQSNVLNNSDVRRALSLLIDRENIASVSFSDFAEPASTPFHPSFYGIKDCSILPVKHDKDAAEELLTSAGFDGFNSEGILYNQEKGKLQLRLLVNKENGFKLATARNIQQTFASVGIDVILKEYSYKNYLSAVEEGSYELYIGEVKLTNSFNLSEFFTEDGAYAYGIDPECKSAEDYKGLLNGTQTMQEFLDTFTDELPFIPLMYRKGITVRSSKIKTASETTVTDYLYNINDWTV